MKSSDTGWADLKTFVNDIKNSGLCHDYMRTVFNDWWTKANAGGPTSKGQDLRLGAAITEYLTTHAVNY